MRSWVNLVGKRFPRCVPVAITWTPRPVALHSEPIRVGFQPAAQCAKF